jgi:hypothetical protein
MSARLPIFNDADGAGEGDQDLDLSGFAPTPSHRPDVAAIRRVAEPLGFVDREGGAASPAAAVQAPRTGQRRHRTGRNKNLSLKVTEEAMQKFYSIVDQQGWVLGEAFAQAVDALEARLRAEGKLTEV